MIVNIAEVWAAVADPHVDYINARIDEFLSMHLPTRPVQDDVEARAVRFVRRYRHRIASTKHTEFSRLITVFEGRFPEESTERKWAIELFKAVFDYGEFSNKYAKGWNAYRLCAGARWNVCPYCHIHGTETHIPDENEKGGYRPQIDHYYPQSKYPFLGLTLGNLIPCCAQCNGPGFKHTNNFYKTPHLNPLADVENIGFRIETADATKTGDPIVRAFRAPLSDYRVALFPLAPCAKTQASLVTFQLSKRYQQHVAEARRIAADVLQKKALQTAFEKPREPEDRLRDATSRDRMRADVFDFSTLINTAIPFDPDSDDEYKNHVAGKMVRDVFLKARDG